MKSIAWAVCLAFVVTACLPPRGTLFHTTLTGPDESYTLPIALGDQTALVTGIEPTEGDPTVSDPIVQGDPSDPNAVIVRWLGGLCDNDVALSLTSSESGYALHLEVHGKLGLGCPAVGVLRGLRIKTSKPIPADSIAVSGHG